jgi:hypothetical protein
MYPAAGSWVLHRQPLSRGAGTVTEGHDARLLDGLRTALGRDARPAGLLRRSAGLLAHADPGGALAELLDPPAAEPVGVRGPAMQGGPAGALVFEVGDGSLAVEVAVTRDRLDGQVLAGGPAEVVLERVRGPARACPVDDLGRFAFARPGSGPGRLRLRGDPTGPVATDWFFI